MACPAQYPATCDRTRRAARPRPVSGRPNCAWARMSGRRSSSARPVSASKREVVLHRSPGLTREGFDLTRHAGSLLANGDLGWIQVINFVVTGLMLVAGAAGIRRALGGGRWGPRLLAAYGVGVIGAGVFTADPTFGFPAGTPNGTGRGQRARPAAPDHRQPRVPRVHRGVLRDRPPVRCRGRASLGGVLTEHRHGLPGRFHRNRLRLRLRQPAGVVGFLLASAVGWVWISTLCARLYRQTT